MASLPAPADIVDTSNPVLTRYWEFAAPPPSSSAAAVGSTQVQPPPVIVDMVSGIEIDIDTIAIPRVGYLPTLVQVRCRLRGRARLGARLPAHTRAG